MFGFWLALEPGLSSRSSRYPPRSFLLRSSRICGCLTSSRPDDCGPRRPAESVGMRLLIAKDTLVKISVTARDRLTFRGYTSSNFNIWFFNNHSFCDRFTSGTSILSSDHPFTIRVCKSVGWYDADTGLVITAISRTKSNTPFSLSVVSTK